MRQHLRLFALVSVALLVALPSAAATAREMYAAASAQAKSLRDAAAARGGAPVSAKQYRMVVAAFEAVVRRHPTTGYADNALMEGADLARDAHERFGDDRDLARAQRLWSWLVDEYPTSPLVPKARQALKLLKAAQASAPAADVKRPAPVVTQAREEEPAVATVASAPVPAGLITLRDIRRTVLGDTVRVSIELDAEVTYRSERLENPARVLFDLASTRIGPAVPEGTLTYGGEIVRHVRIGRHPNHVVRVVLDLEGVKRYSVFTLYGPYRIVVDCERGSGLPGLPKERIAEEKVQAPQPDPESEAALPGPTPKPLERRPLRGPIRAIVPVAGTASKPLLTVEPGALQPPLLRATRRFAAARGWLAWQPTIEMPAPVPHPPVGPAVADSRASAPPPQSPKPAVAAAVEAEAPAVSLADRPSPTPDKPLTPSQPLVAPPNGFSMARQLGLGASRIVIDPGHGGHDPGAEGAGVFEAAIVLDVALRLEKLLIASGSEVVLTRRTDQYIPLEERTAIANRSQGDLFLSIHANASRNRAARGIESYVLNFATTPDAEAVAARENASTGLTMSSLTEIVKAIALNNKLDESRSFAGMVQRQLAEHLEATNKGLRNHGVKQAPFVVLIGASMPSVLVEISFITNSQEGRLLKSGAYRQKIAEALLDAIRSYQRSLKGAPALVHQ